MIETIIKIPTKIVENGIFDLKTSVKEKYWTQYICTVGVSLTFLITGLQSGWCGPTLLKLSNPNSTIPLTDDEQGWLATSMLMGSIPGALMGSLLADTLGRQKTLLLTIFPNMMAFVLVYFADNVFMLYISQSLSGVSTSISYVAVPIYISETSSPKIRGMLGLVMGLFLGIGNIVEFILVPYMSLKTNAIFCFIVTVIALLSILIIPETPYFYLMKNNLTDAKRTLQFFRLRNDVDQELADLEIAWKQSQNENISVIDIFKSVTYRKCFFICIGVIAAQQFNGMIPIIGYCPIILHDIQAPISNHLMSVLLMVLFTVATLSSTFFIDSWGRKPLLFFATYGSIIPYSLIGIFFYFQYIQFNVQQYSLIPIFSLIFSAICYGGALNSLPYIYTSELFPTNYRALAGSMCTLISALMEMTATKGFQVVRDNLGIYWCFWFFALFNLISGTYSSVFVPETKGKSLEQIQKQLKQ